MTAHRLALAWLLVGLAGQARAQAGAAQNPSPTPDEVVVTATKPPAQTTIDRKSYSLSTDLQATTGAADAVLRNIPSVDVDAAGNVTLRGDPNVQILIDGKPSPLMSPANRASALQQMGADQIDRIEVLTNPSAQYKPDGSSGVINIITKRNRKAGASGGLQASLGTEGRFNLGASGAYNTGPVNLFATLTARQDERKRISADLRSGLDTTTGAPEDSRQAVSVETRRLSLIETVGGDYDLTRADRLSASATYNDRKGKPIDLEHDQAADPIGSTTSDYQRVGLGHEREVNTQLSAKYRHSFADEGHELSLDYQRGQTIEHQAWDYQDDYQVPAGPPTYDLLHTFTDELTQELTAEYAALLPGKAKGVFGYDLQRDDNEYDNRGASLQGGGEIVDPTLTNRFLYGESIHALYATYDRDNGALDLIAGLRLEEVIQDTNQATSGLKDHLSYFRLYPTLHLSYEASKTQTLRASFSHRVDRPRAEDLNPYPVYQDAFSLRAGNARLMPQETQSLEAGYEYHPKAISWQVTAYYRQYRNGISDVSRYVDGDVLLTTKANIGSGMSAGAETALRGKLTAWLKYNLSSNLYYNAIDASNLGFAAGKSITTGSAKASFDLTLSPRDQVQIGASYTGRTLTAQGWRLAAFGANAGYRRKLTADLSLVTTITDAFASLRDRYVIDTADLHDEYSRHQLGRTVYLGLSWSWGGARKPAEPKFDYSTGG